MMKLLSWFQGFCQLFKCFDIREKITLLLCAIDWFSILLSCHQKSVTEWGQILI